MYYIENCLIFEMEWIEILQKHPKNPFPQAYQSGSGRIKLFQPKIVECTLAVKGSGNVCSVKDIRALDYYGLEFLVYKQEGKKTDGYYAELFMDFDRDSCYENIALKIEYQSSAVAWDTLNGISWMIIKFAKEKDYLQLAEMRWLHCEEDDLDYHEHNLDGVDKEKFISEFVSFLQEHKEYQISIAVEGDIITCAMFVYLVPKIPRPNSNAKYIAYLTNVYTRKEYRNQLIGNYRIV